MLAAGKATGGNSAAKAARDAQASRPSRPMAATALLHQPSHLCRCQEAPRSLAATSSDPHVSMRIEVKEHQIVEKSSKKKRTATEKMSGTSASMAVTMPVDLAAPYSSYSNAECGERGVSWQAQAGSGTQSRLPGSDAGSTWVRRTAQSQILSLREEGDGKLGLFVFTFGVDAQQLHLHTRAQTTTSG